MAGGLPTATGALNGVIDTATGAGAAHVCVTASPSGSSSPWAPAHLTGTSRSGDYQLFGLAPGRYRISAVSCPRPGTTGHAVEPAREPVARFDETVVAGVDRKLRAEVLPPPVVRLSSSGVLPRADVSPARASASLGAGVRISGLVERADGALVKDSCVLASESRADSGYAVEVSTDGGRYAVGGLPPGRWTVMFSACGRRLDLAPQWWDRKSSERDATVLDLKHGSDARDVDGYLVTGAEISGRVVDEAGAGLGRICVEAANGDVESETETDKQGDFTVRSLSTGRYSLTAAPCGTSRNVAQETLPNRVAVRDDHTTTGVTVRLPPGGTVSGTITTAGGQPLSGICVEASGEALVNALSEGEPASTDASGRFVIDQLPPGSYDVEAGAEGCGNTGNYVTEYYPGVASGLDAESVAVHSGATTTADISLEPGASVEGQVRTSAGRGLQSCVALGATSGFLEATVEPLPDAVDVLYEYGGLSNAKGRFDVEHVPPGVYSVLFLPGCAERRTRFAATYLGGTAVGPGRLLSVSEGETVRGLGVAASRGVTLTGRFLEEGRPARESSPSCLTLEQPRSAAGVLEAQLSVGRTGAFTVRGMPPGRYLIEAWDCSARSSFAPRWAGGANRPSAAQPVRLVAGRERHVEFDLRRAATISGEVTVPPGASPRGVCIFAYNAVEFAEEAASASGRYLLGGLGSGSYDVEFFGCGRASNEVGVLTRNLLLQTGRQTTGVDATLTPGGTVTGALESPGGGPVAASCVYAVAANPDLVSGSAISTPEGAFVLRGVPPGTDELRVDPGCEVPDGFAPAALGSLTVAAGATTSLGTLVGPEQGGISGVVTSSTAVPLPGICVTAYPLGRTAALSSPELSETDASGQYALEWLGAGRYDIEFTAGCGSSGYAAQWWKGSVDRSGARPVRVRNDTGSSGIDATMAGG